MPRENGQDALELAGMEWQVMPLHTWAIDHCDCGKRECASPAKHPRTQHGLDDATTDLPQISRWWSQWPAANVGVATGPDSGIVVVDIDPRHGGTESWIKLREEHGYEHEGPACLTGGGGLHLYFQHPGTKIRNSSGEVAEGVDIKGDRGYVCRVDSALTLRADLTWVPIGDLKVGDVLLAPTEDRVGISHGGGVRQWRESVVTATSLMESETVRVVMGSGRELICTPDHRFLASRFGKQGGAVWMEAQNLLRCSTDRRASGIAKGFPFLPRYMEPWVTDRSYEAGWFAGVLDGEGWTDGYRVAIAQREGIVSEKIRDFLRSRHWEWRENIDKESGVVQFSPSGTKSDIMRLLGETRPVRLLAKQVAYGELLQRSNYGWSGFDPVVAVEPAGRREVCVLSTSTGTFVDEGYISHNCAPPSVHAAGTSYAWIEGYAPWERVLPEIPDWLLEAMRKAPEGDGMGAHPIADRIRQGQRRNVLLSLAGSMRHRNMGEQAIFNALMAENAEKCEPPMETQEVAKIAAAAGSWEPGSAFILPSTKPNKEKAQVRTPEPFTLAELEGEEIEPVRWAVPGLLPEGLAILAGKAKLGKSWMALGLLLALGFGEDAFSYFPTLQGDGLYLALEDTKRRLKNRTKALMPEGGWPARVWCEVLWPTADSGGLEAIEAWLGKHPEARLVVIDTFALFKPQADGKRADVYAADYAAVSAVKQVADRYGVCIMLITHLNKGDHEDWVNNITGSTGISGSADTLINLDRPRKEAGQGEAMLLLTGRDVEEKTWGCQMTGGKWTITGDLDEVQQQKEYDEVRLRMREMWADGVREVTAHHLAKFTGKKTQTCNRALLRAAREGFIIRLRQGTYHLREDDQPSSVSENTSDKFAPPKKFRVQNSDNNDAEIWSLDEV